MKKNGKSVAAVIATFTVFVLLVCITYPVLEMKDSEDRYSTFYRCEKNFDILFLGTSHVMNGISPMRLWHEYGYTSCSLAGPGCRIPVGYWLLREALTRTNPSLVVIDCATLESIKVLQDTSYNHVAFDHMPLSKVKLQAIFDLYHDRVNQIVEFLFPFCIYHNRWSSLKTEDLRSHKNAMFGYDAMFIRKDQNWSAPLIADEAPELDNYGTEYLERIVDLCRENGVNILLTYIPYNSESESAAEAAWVRDYALREKIPFLGPDDLVEAIDIHTDFAYDAHLNYWGAKKMTDYFGAYFNQHYQLVDSRKTPDLDYWQSFYNEYVQEIMTIAREAGYPDLDVDA